MLLNLLKDPVDFLLLYCEQEVVNIDHDVCFVVWMSEHVGF